MRESPNCSLFEMMLLDVHFHLLSSIASVLLLLNVSSRQIEAATGALPYYVLYITLYLHACSLTKDRCIYMSGTSLTDVQVDLMQH